MYKRIVFAVWIVFAFACKESSTKNQYPAIDVTGYLSGQLNLIDTVPYSLLKVTEKEGLTPDSMYLTKERARAMIAPFLSKEITQSQLEKNYIETSFADASTASVTISYKAKEEAAVIQQIDVYFDPPTGAIRQLYLTGFYNTETGLTKKQLLWFHNKGGQIINTPMQGNGQTIRERLIWL